MRHAMKNLLVIAVTVALGYLLWPVQQQPPAPPAPLAAVAKPAPSAASKLYFHSALDAPAMPTSDHTGTSYFSTESTSRFNAGSSGLGYGSTGAYTGAGSTVVMVPAGQPASAQSSAGTGRAAASGVTVGIAQANRMMAERASANRAAAPPSRKLIPIPASARTW